MKTKAKTGREAIAGFACLVLACVISGCAERPNPSALPTLSDNEDTAPPARRTDARSRAQHPAKRNKETLAATLTPEAESNPCRATALVLEQLLEKSTRDFAQQTRASTKTRP